MFVYGMRSRGFSIGCQPKDGLIGMTDIKNERYYDVIAYDRKLSEKECDDYQLDYLGEEEDGKNR